jgi:hypothetical protein
MFSGDGIILDQTISNFNTVPTNGATIGLDMTVNTMQMRLLQYVFPLFLRYSHYTSATRDTLYLSGHVEMYLTHHLAVIT